MLIWRPWADFACCLKVAPVLNSTEWPRRRSMFISCSPVSQSRIYVLMCLFTSLQIDRNACRFDPFDCPAIQLPVARTQADIERIRCSARNDCKCACNNHKHPAPRTHLQRYMHCNPQILPRSMRGCFPLRNRDEVEPLVFPSRNNEHKLIRVLFCYEVLIGIPIFHIPSSTFHSKTGQVMVHQ